MGRKAIFMQAALRYTYGLINNPFANVSFTLMKQSGVKENDFTAHS
jgi:hypothetical protein